MPFTETTVNAQRVLTFGAEGDFEALREAQAWCEAQGISYAPGCARSGHLSGLLYGDFDIAKYRNLSARERSQLDGVMRGGRNGPVTLTLKPRRKPAAKSASPA